MAWQVLLEKNGIINSFLAAIGLPRLAIINTSAAVVLGMVYDYLPFMVLPIYNAIVRIDQKSDRGGLRSGRGKEDGICEDHHSTQRAGASSAV